VWPTLVAIVADADAHGYGDEFVSEVRHRISIGDARAALADEAAGAIARGEHERGGA